MRLRVISNGTPAGTLVYTEDGTPVTNVRSLIFDVGLDRPARILLELTDVCGEFTFDLADAQVRDGDVAWTLGPDGGCVLYHYGIDQIELTHEQRLHIRSALRHSRGA